MVTRILLQPHWFTDQELNVASCEGITVTAFCFRSGVKALRITNERGEIVVLPYQGQQIWSAQFDGRELTMVSMFNQPIPTRNYLETYGAFFIHCGVTAIGAPGPQDDHPLHGELPNAPFDDAALVIDEEAGTVSLVGSFTYVKAFAYHYVAEARITLHRAQTVMDVSLQVENRKNTPMDVMYLGHANFRPVDYGELIYSAPYDANHVRVRTSIPGHISPPDGYRAFLEVLSQDPQKHHVLDPEMAFDPEVVFTLDMQADSDGFAHALHKHPDGRGDYIRFRPDQTPMATRWICRTADQQGLGMAFPSTSEVEGYTAEKAKGQYVSVAGGARWRCDIRLGALDREETKAVAERIDALLLRGAASV